MEKLSGAQRRLRKKLIAMKRQGEGDFADYISWRVDQALGLSERLAQSGSNRRVFEAVDQLRSSLRTVNSVVAVPELARLSRSGLAVAKSIAAKTVSQMYELERGRS